MQDSMSALQDFAIGVFEIGALFMSFALAILVVALICMYIADVTQTSHTIRRN